MNNISSNKSPSGFLAVSVSVMFWSLLVLPFATSCSKDNEPDIPADEQIVKEGMEMYTRAYADGELIEEVVDEIKNLGTAEKPILFHVNKSHKVKGEDVPPGKADLDGVFLSLTQEEYDGFIRLFAVMQGLAETDRLTDDQKKEAFTALFAYLKQYDIDLPLLIYLSSGNIGELRATDKIIRSDNSRADYSGIDANTKLRYLLQNNIKPSQAVAEPTQYSTRSDFVWNPCGLLVNGNISTTDQKYRLVHDAKKVQEYDRLFASLINVNDLDLSHYWDSYYYDGRSYELTYGSNLTPMSHVKFHVHTEYETRCKTLQGRYVGKMQVVIDEAKRTAWMLCDVDVLYCAPQTYEYGNENGSFGPFSKWNKVLVSYGDKACISFKGTLGFHVYGWRIFEEQFWKD